MGDGGLEIHDCDSIQEPATKPKRDSSLHSPTRSQGANAKEKGVGLFRSE
jgi:hypothetical protein